MLQPLTNTEPVDNEFFLRDGAVYFSGLYENGLLKGIAPKDFCCWHYWGKSSTACFLSGIRLRGADPASFRVLNYAYAMDKTAVYTTSGRIPDVELAAFQVLDNGQNDSGAPQGPGKHRAEQEPCSSKGSAGSYQPSLSGESYRFRAFRTFQLQ